MASSALLILSNAKLVAKMWSFDGWDIQVGSHFFRPKVVCFETEKTRHRQRRHGKQTSYPNSGAVLWARVSSAVEGLKILISWYLDVGVSGKFDFHALVDFQASILAVLNEEPWSSHPTHMTHRQRRCYARLLSRYIVQFTADSH
jgi:hypothetical protein